MDMEQELMIGAQVGHRIGNYFGTWFEMHLKIRKKLIKSSNLWQDMRINLQRCTGLCNKKYCNISHVCRPINRTSKIKSLDIYLHSGIKLEAPLYVSF